MKFVIYPSGSVLCCVQYGEGSVMALCSDLDLTLQERQDAAQKEVQDLLDLFAAGEE
jgi:hypothetical protein